MKRYLLFDAACALCNTLAYEIRGESGGWIDDALSLRDSEVRDKLKSGNRADLWEPAILEQDGEQVAIYTGLRLRWRLLRGVGVSRTWRIGRLVAGQISTTSTGPEKLANVARTGPSRAVDRRGFMARAGGTAVGGLAIATGFGFKSAAYAGTGRSEDWLANLTYYEAEPASGDELAAAWNKFRKSTEVQELISSKNFDRYSDAKGIRNTLDATTAPEMFYFVRHTVDGGQKLDAMALQVNSTAIAVYTLGKSQRDDTSRTRAMLLEADESTESASIRAQLENGIFTQQLPAPGAPLPACGNGCNFPCFFCGCTGLDFRCAFNCCGPCGLVCLGGAIACMLCVLAWCPACLSVNRCCNGRACIRDPACQ